MSTKRFFSAVVPMTAWILWAGPAVGAEPRDIASADALFRSAKEAMARGDVAAACVQLGESQRLDPQVGTLLNLADCEERRGALADALGHFQTVTGQLKADDFRLPFAHSHVASLSKRVPKLTLIVHAPSEALEMRVLRDNVEMRPASFGVALPVDPGLHECILRAPGRVDARVSVTLREGDAQTVELTPGPKVAATAAAAAPAHPVSNEALARRTPALAYGAFGVGALAITTGIVTGLLTTSAASTYKDECRDGVCTSKGLDAASTGKTMSIVSPVAFVVGGLAVLGGAALVWRAKAGPGANSVAVAPLVDPRLAGAFVTTSF